MNTQKLRTPVKAFYARLAVYISFITLTTFSAIHAQDTTLTYEKQRQKVNNLLQQRSNRFGAFNESLQKKTGIFGFKTKKDMQASIDILKQIVLTDNDIFKETKTLLDYKDVQKSGFEEQANKLGHRVNGYINTISNMQKEREALRTSLAAAEKSSQTYILFLFFAFIGIAVLGYLLFRKQKLTKN